MGIADYKQLIAGFSGGFAATIVCHPLDLLRIRYSVNDNNASLRPQYRSYFHAVKSIVEAEGIRGLYQGLTPNIIASPLAWGLYFQFYHQMHPHFNYLSDVVSLPFQNLVVGCAAGASVMAVSNPLWVAKTRLCLQYENEGAKKYRGMIHCLKKILQEEGIKGWYRGFVPALFGTLNGAIQFAIYNYLKDWRYKTQNLSRDTPLGTLDYLVFSSTSKMLSTASTYPYQVIRARLQDHHTNYKSSREVMYRIMKKEGFTGFYKGMLMTTLKQLPNGIVTYMVYEHSKQLIEKYAD
uniref:Mitochondrial folate transporter/carrier n=1 Tax=Panagrolaimus sp. ES5 TaxID=591445 RepID=A0AC34FUU0_9BILA